MADVSCSYMLRRLAVALVGMILVSSGLMRAPFGTNALSMDYYMMSCPVLELIVKNSINTALQSDPTLAGPLLRMHFHDCFVQVLRILIFRLILFLMVDSASSKKKVFLGFISSL